jgi:hypothetical protein
VTLVLRVVRSPWTAADALVGLFRRAKPPNNTDIYQRIMFRTRGSGADVGVRPTSSTIYRDRRLAPRFRDQDSPISAFGFDGFL